MGLGDSGDILPSGDDAIFYLCVAPVLLTGDVGWGLCLPDGADADGHGCCVPWRCLTPQSCRQPLPALSESAEPQANSPAGFYSNLRMRTRVKTPQNKASLRSRGLRRGSLARHFFSSFLPQSAPKVWSSLGVPTGHGFPFSAPLAVVFPPIALGSSLGEDLSLMLKHLTSYHSSTGFSGSRGRKGRSVKVCREGKIVRREVLQISRRI